MRLMDNLMDGDRIDELVLFADGASRGNPGPSGAGVTIVTPNGKTLLEKAVFLGEGTNNAAEYRALIIGLKELKRFMPERVVIKMDSELVVRQLNGKYRVRSPVLIPLYQQAKELIRELPVERITHIHRKDNHQADRLANLAIDAKNTE